jgi:hypothetical protein
MNASAALRGQLLDRRPAPVPAAPGAGAATCPLPARAESSGRKARSPNGVRSVLAAGGQRRCPGGRSNEALPTSLCARPVEPPGKSTARWKRSEHQAVVLLRRELGAPNRRRHHWFKKKGATATLPSAPVPARSLKCRSVFVWLKTASIARSLPQCRVAPGCSGGGNRGGEAPSKN